MQPLNSWRNWFNGPRRILRLAARFVTHRAIASVCSSFESFQIEADPRADEAIERELAGGGVGTVISIAALSLVPSRMEDTMCWEIDYKFFAEQKKAKEIEQQRRVIDQLLNEAQKQDDKSNVEETPVKETAPAK